MTEDAEDEIKVDAKNSPSVYKVHMEAQRIRAFKITYQK